MRATVKIYIMQDGVVCETFSYESLDPATLSCEVFVYRSSLVRSPLHSQALNLDDIKDGLNIQCFISWGAYPNRAMIVGEPFRRSSKYSDTSSRDPLMVSVVTTDADAKIVQEDWYLRDMGVVPHEDKISDRWNGQNYTLAVE